MLSPKNLFSFQKLCNVPPLYILIPPEGNRFTPTVGPRETAFTFSVYSIQSLVPTLIFLCGEHFLLVRYRQPTVSSSP